MYDKSISREAIQQRLFVLNSESVFNETDLLYEDKEYAKVITNCETLLNTENQEGNEDASFNFLNITKKLKLKDYYLQVCFRLFATYLPYFFNIDRH
jgi:hypothetical protein